MIEGKNITIEYRFAENKGADRVSALASDLVRLQVDLIVASGAGPSVAAKKLTTVIPIVMATSVDPVGAGLVASLARCPPVFTTPALRRCCLPATNFLHHIIRSLAEAVAALLSESRKCYRSDKALREDHDERFAS